MKYEVGEMVRLIKSDDSMLKSFVGCIGEIKGAFDYYSKDMYSVQFKFDDSDDTFKQTFEIMKFSDDKLNIILKEVKSKFSIYESFLEELPIEWRLTTILPEDPLAF